MIDLGIRNLRIKKAGRSGIYALFKEEDLVSPLTNLEEHLASMIEELKQQLAAVEAKNKELEAIVKSYRDSLVDRLMEYKAVSDE